MGKKHMLLNTAVIGQIKNAELVLGKVEKYGENPLFLEDFFSNPPREWEPRYDNGYPNVFYDETEGIYRCYYTLFLKDEESSGVALSERVGKQYQPTAKRVTGFCYAFSKDGIHWEKPSLGLVEFNGSKENNILFKYAHGASVFLDKHEPDPSKRYKFMARMDDLDGMAVSFSGDGIHWEKLIPWPKYNPTADTHNFAYWDDRLYKYVLITRLFRDGVRIVARCESDDFVHWSEPVEVFRGMDYHDQIYSMPCFRYEDVTLGFASMFRRGDSSLPDWDKVDCELTFSTDTIHWNRVCCGDSFIPRGEGDYPNGEYDCGCIYASVPVLKENELLIYYMGGNGQHTNYRETGLCLCKLPKDRFAGYTQRKSGSPAELAVRTEYTPNGTVSLTADVEAGGVIRAALFTATGKPIEGFGFDDCDAVTSDITDGTLSWNGKLFPDDVDARGVYLRFQFEKATLYAYTL